MASKIGAGIFQNAYGHGANVVTAGQKDYQMRMMQIEKQREDYYRKLGTPPGVPTMKGATAEPENTHEGYNTIIRELGDHSVPDGWIQRPKRNAVPGTPPGPPVQWDKAEDPDDVQPGYGYVPADTTHEDIFYYHSDHLGSTSYITDAKANVAQFDAYLPYGELLVDEHSSSEEMPYKFNGKEFDQETGLYYYGARYMNPRTSLWYGVDPLAEKYPEIGGYAYCHDNPINRSDKTGLADYFNKHGKFIKTTDDQKDPNIYVMSGDKGVKLSDYNFSREKDGKRAMMRIVFHYAYAQGTPQSGAIIGVDSKGPASNDDDFETLAYTLNDRFVRVVTKGWKFDKVLNNKFNMMSTMRHEKYHFDMKDHDKDEEVQVIMRQIESSEFKKTTLEYKKNVMLYLQNELIKLCKDRQNLFYKHIDKASKYLHKYGEKYIPQYINGGNEITF